MVVTGYYPLVSEESDPLKVVTLVHRYCPELTTVANIVERAVLAPLAEQSHAWGEASDEVLRQAVDSANQTGMSGVRVAFAPVPFGPEHCYAAPASWLWELGEEDSVRTERLSQCVSFAFGDPLCPFEPAFHPNRVGAAAYARAVRNVLELLLKERE